MKRGNSLGLIKKEIESHVGEKIMLKDSGGRRKIFIKNGVIEKAYSSIFVIKLDEENERRVSYTYSDVLTKTVQIVFAC